MRDSSTRMGIAISNTPTACMRSPRLIGHPQQCPRKYRGKPLLGARINWPLPVSPPVHRGSSTGSRSQCRSAPCSDASARSTRPAARIEGGHPKSSQAAIHACRYRPSSAYEKPSLTSNSRRLMARTVKPTGAIAITSGTKEWHTLRFTMPVVDPVAPRL